MLVFLTFDVGGGQIETTEPFKLQNASTRAQNSGTSPLTPALRNLVLQTHQMEKNVVATILTKPTIVYCNVHTL